MNIRFKFTICFLVAVVFVSLQIRDIQAAELQFPRLDDIVVSALIGKPEDFITPTPPPGDKRFTLVGYTSPNALVTIQNPGIHNEVFARPDGYFVFKYLGLSQFKEDICLIAKDTESRPTPPLCIPPPSVQDDNKEIGPVLLPPSTSISSGNAYIGDTVTLTGQTMPNVDVKLSLFTDERIKNKKLAFILNGFVPEANAYTIPQVSLTSNEKGEYSMTLPTASSQFLRMFSRALYNGNSTPKGNTLILDIFPLWMILFKFFINFFSLLKAHIVELIILTQLYFLLMYVLRKWFNPHFISVHRHRELMLAQKREITVTPHDLVVQKTDLALRGNLSLNKM